MPFLLGRKPSRFSNAGDEVPPSSRRNPSAGLGGGRRWRSGPLRRPPPVSRRVPVARVSLVHRGNRGARGAVFSEPASGAGVERVPSPGAGVSTRSVEAHDLRVQGARACRRGRGFRPSHRLGHTALTETAECGVPAMLVQTKAGHARARRQSGSCTRTGRATRTLRSWSARLG